jgi:uncharacterized membrane protein YbhN (UPF0104 family)
MAATRLKRALRLVVPLIAIGLLAAAVANQWSSVRAQATDLSVGWEALGLAAVLVGLFCAERSWQALLADLGSSLPTRAGIRVFFLSQLGKYVPGSVWPVLAQMELGRTYRVPRRRSAAAAMVTLALSVAAGAIVTVVALPFGTADAFRRAGWLLLVLPVLAVALHPPIFRSLLNRVLRLARRGPLEDSFTRAGELKALGWAVAGWLCLGVQCWAIVRDVGGTEARLFPLSVGAFAAAWTAGFLVVLAPAGLGVREGVLIAFLGGPLGVPKATVVAICSRLLMSLGDAIWAGLALFASRGSRQVTVSEAAVTVVTATEDGQDKDEDRRR